MKSTKNDGIVAESIVPQINGHASADPFSAPSSAWAAGTGVQDDRDASEDAAVWIPDVMLADHLDAASGDVISEVVDEDVWQAFRGFKNRYNIAITRETVFGEIGVVPAGIAHACGLEPTLADVAEFIDNYGYPLPDPCVEGDRLEAERFQRFHERDTVARELKPQGIAPDTEYALSEVERVCGAQVADAARCYIEQFNIDTWNMGPAAARKNHRDEHTYLVTAAELVSARLAVPAKLVAAMVTATPLDRSTAWSDLAEARLRHRNGGVVDHDPVSRRWLTAHDLDNLPTPGYLVDKLLPRNALVRMSGMSETLKSFIAFDMSLSIATGTPFLGHDRFDTAPPAHVLYVVGEGAQGVRKRIRAWCQRRGVDYAKAMTNLTVLHGAAQFASQRDMAEVAAKARETSAVLVVFDTQARCTQGLEEDSATQMGKAVAGVDALMAQTGVTALVLHHTPKRDPRTARGSVAWTNAADAEFIAVRDGKELEVTLEVSKMKDDDNTGVYPIKAVKVAVPGVGESLVLEPGSDPITAAFDPDRPMEQWTGKGAAYAKSMYALAQENCIPGDGLTQHRLSEIANEIVGTELYKGKSRDKRRVCSKNTAVGAVQLLVQHKWLVVAKRDPLGHVFYEPKDYPPLDPAAVNSLTDEGNSGA
ncbi:AAA family ATPase [Mycobacteroides abscessus]|uniref:AAA family ATPase n=1 Tax=Mycobacteroides abscessus TaxID=36809 RepID=UPI00092B2BE0|nr:AAA family ATPase [Mycobacteroides abscessus]SIL05480.1 Uncharacterised protein [Mycobacteroides abscessus subsp. abscessus]